MKRLILYLLPIAMLFALIFVTACSAPSAAPTVSAATAVSAPATATASPTDTAIPSTDTPTSTNTPVPTDTPTVARTKTPTAAPPTETPIVTPTSTPTPVPPTATRRSSKRVPPTNTPLPTLVWATQLVAGGPGYSGPIDVIVWNYYPNPLTFTIGGTTLTVHTYENYPPNTGMIIINGPGSYAWSASAPGYGEAAGIITFPVATKGVFFYFNHANPYQ